MVLPNQPRRGVITMRVTAPGHAGEKKETLLFLLFAPPTEWRKRGFKSGLGHLFIPFVCPVSRLDGGVRTKSEAAAAKGKGRRRRMGEGPLSPLPTPALGQRRKGGGEMGGVTQKMEGIPKN